MKIENLKDLKALIQLAKKEGVEYMCVDGVEFNLSAAALYPTDKPKRQNVSAIINNPSLITEDTSIDTPDELTEEQLLYYSATGEEQ